MKHELALLSVGPSHSLQLQCRHVSVHLSAAWVPLTFLFQFPLSLSAFSPCSTPVLSMHVLLYIQFLSVLFSFIYLAAVLLAAFFFSTIANSPVLSILFLLYRFILYLFILYPLSCLKPAKCNCKASGSSNNSKTSGTKKALLDLAKLNMLNQIIARVKTKCIFVFSQTCAIS